MNEETFDASVVDEVDYDELMDSVVTACCVHRCQVEPDGHCEHGNPSVLLQMGLI